MTDWESEADVVVCGFGGAGACAAIEAADAGAEVRIVDRFDGGGATRKSGGVIYAGGGTSVQRRAGVEDSVDAMHAYLADETRDAVSEAALRRFRCDRRQHVRRQVVGDHVLQVGRDMESHMTAAASQIEGAGTAAPRGERGDLL